MPKRELKEKTRKKIIKAAKIVFAEKGYQKAIITDIAKQAGLSEATIYGYFESKEDLLLTIPDLWVKDHIRELKGQLFGIKGAFNKLRKFLWWHLQCMERDPLEAKIVFLFLKTSTNLIKNTEVYPQVVDFYSHLLKIFEEGIAAGEMDPKLNPYVARDIVIGTVDRIITRWLLKDMSYSLFDNMEETFELLVKAFRADSRKPFNW